MAKMNKKWHAGNAMPKHPSEVQRIKWHLAHVRNCKCRAIPRGVLALMKALGIPVPLVSAGQAGK